MRDSGRREIRGQFTDFPRCTGAGRAARPWEIGKLTPDFPRAVPTMRVLLLFTALLAAGAGARAAEPDVIIVGAGISGIAAALEAEARGARVLIIDMNSVPGGHAVKAGGFALVDTPLQRQKGYQDSPEVAERDLLAWGETADAGWVRRYVQASGREVGDWLAALGVRWAFILDTPEHSVPRFHFAAGSALNVVVPMLRSAMTRERIEWRLNTQALEVTQRNGAVTGIVARNLRSSGETRLPGRAVILATGGFQANLDLVRASWRTDIPPPPSVYAGAGYFANGSGIALGRDAGAALTRMRDQVTFTTGLPDPLDPAGERALLTQNPAAIWVNAEGRRYVAENAPSKLADDATLRQPGAAHWIVFDADGAKSLRIRDAVWLGNPGAAATLANHPSIARADSLAALAAAAGLPADALQATVARYNAALAAGNDADFGRFAPGRPDREARPIVTPPFSAVRLYPMTRKSMGGLAVDDATRVLDERGRPVPGLYAVGEATGVAGINGRYGGEGTFLGPSVWMGRLAGQAVAPAGSSPAAPAAIAAPPAPPPDPATRDRVVLVSDAAFAALVAAERPGYWHFQRVHRTVAERGLDCQACHTTAWPTITAATPAHRLEQLRSCTTCH
jgi:predicted oxidoreductase